MLGSWLGLSPRPISAAFIFLGATAACAYRFLFQPLRLDFYAAARLREGVLPPPRARLLVGFVLNEVRRDDLVARFAEALDAAVKREVVERAQPERGRAIVGGGGGGKLTLFAEGVEVLENKWNSLSLFLL